MNMLLEEATVNFLYAIYRQISRNEDPPGCTLTELSIQFDRLCEILDDEVRARRLLVLLLEESTVRVNRLCWIWEEMQFEIEAHRIRDRKACALAQLTTLPQPVGDEALDLFNQRMKRIIL